MEKVKIRIENINEEVLSFELDPYKGINEYSTFFRIMLNFLGFINHTIDAVLPIDEDEYLDELREESGYYQTKVNELKKENHELKEKLAKYED